MTLTSNAIGRDSSGKWCNLKESKKSKKIVYSKKKFRIFKTFQGLIYEMSWKS